MWPGNRAIRPATVPEPAPPPAQCRRSALTGPFQAPPARPGTDVTPILASLTSKVAASMPTTVHPWLNAARSSSWLTRRGPQVPG